MFHKLSNVVERVALSFALAAVGAVVACSAAPTDEVTSQVGEDIQRICLPAPCNTGCAAKPGVSGGQCSAGACVCNAPTCGALNQRPCAGNQCSQGHYDARRGLCDNCGTLGATCCNDLSNPADATACYGGLFCQGGIACRTCGGENEDACDPATGAPFCDHGLAVGQNQSNGSPTCVANCGHVGELPCLNGGCVDRTSTVLPGSPLCQYQTCGGNGAYCCNPNAKTPICQPGLECDWDDNYGYQHPYVCTPKGYTLQGGACVSNCEPTGGGGSGDGDNCDPSAEDCCDPLIDDCS